MKNLNYLKLSMVVIPLLMITACGDDPENEDNHLPTVSIMTDDKSQTVNAGEEATVSAKAFDVDGDSLTYLWSIKSKPSGSEAQLSNSRTKNVSIVTDESGDYILSFVANDGFSDSTTVTAKVHASSPDPVVPDEIDDNDKEDDSKDSDAVTNKTGIVSAWTIDIPKADQIVNGYEEDDPTGLFVGLKISAMKDIQFKENGTCTISGKDINTKCWEANGNEYIFYGDDDKQSAIIEVNDNILKIKFEENENSKAMELEYTRVDEATLVPPSVVMKKDRVYHARDIEHKEFNDKSDAFLMFTEGDKYYWMITKDSLSFTASELKDIMNEDNSSKRSELIGSNYSALIGDSYYVKNNAFYTVIGGKKIEVVTSSHIRYDGYDYYLE
jgi:hypothetical protein